MSFAKSSSPACKRYRLAQDPPVETRPDGGPPSISAQPVDAPRSVDVPLWLIAGVLIILGILILLLVVDRTFPPTPPQVPGGTTVPTTTAPEISGAVTPSPTVVPTEVPAACPGAACPTPQVVVQVVTVVVPDPGVYQQPIMVPQLPAYDYGYAHRGGYPGQGHGCGSSFPYVVQPGDTVYGLARRFGVRPDAIISVNGLCNPNLIRVGQVLQIPCVAAY